MRRAYVPSDFRQRTFASTSASSTIWHIVRSTPHNRCSCSGLSRRPGISRNSAQIRSTSCGFGEAVTISPRSAAPAPPSASHRRRDHAGSLAHNTTQTHDRRCRDQSPQRTPGWASANPIQESASRPPGLLVVSLVSPSGDSPRGHGLRRRHCDGRRAYAPVIHEIVPTGLDESGRGQARVRADGQPQESRPGAYHDCYAFPRRTTRTYSALKHWSSRSASPESEPCFHRARLLPSRCRKQPTG